MPQSHFHSRLNVYISLSYQIVDAYLKVFRHGRFTYFDVYYLWLFRFLRD